MANVLPALRTVSRKAGRETILLVAAAGAIAMSLVYGARPEPRREAVAPTPPQVWTGHLADVAPASATPSPEPLTSASLVVPKSAMALPAAPRATSKTRLPPVPPTRRQIASLDDPSARLSAPRSEEHHSLIHNLNPLNHLPDTLRRPFSYARETVSGWLRSF